MGFGAAREDPRELGERLALTAHDAEHQHGDGRDDRLQIGALGGRTETLQVVRMRRRTLTDEDVEARMVDVDARLDADFAERRQHADGVFDRVLVAVEPVAGPQIQREGAVHHHRRGCEPEAGERVAGRREPASGRDQHRDPTLLELAPCRHRVGVRHLVAEPQGRVEIRNDEIHGGHR